MLHRQFPDLPVDPSSVDRDRLLARSEGRDDRRMIVIERALCRSAMRAKAYCEAS
jgi:hypothetical protein